MLNTKTQKQSNLHGNKSWSIFIVLTICLSILLSLFLLISYTKAAPETQVYFDGFEANTASWGGSGSITRTPSGTGGIPAAEGDYYAVVDGSHIGPNTQLGGYSSVWPGDWKSSIDIYMDPSWDAGSGFIYSVAVNKPGGTALRDFMLQAGVLNDESTGGVNKFVALADTAGSPTSDPLYHIKAMPADRRAEITEAGWYTLDHYFQNINGRLVPTITLSNQSGDKIKDWVIDYEWMNDMVPDAVGGNRYGWFTHVVVPGGVAIDNVSRSVSANEYNIRDDATSPVNVMLQENQTIAFVDVVNGVTTTPVDITVAGAKNNVQVFVPATTQITAEDDSWDGILNAPSVESIDALSLLDGTPVSVSLAIKVGADTPLQFSQPVKLTLPGQAGKEAGYLDGEHILHAITARCDDGPATVIVDGINECYTTDGDNLIIWTNHFSVYLAYEPTDGLVGAESLANTGQSAVLLSFLGLGIVGLSYFAYRKSRT